MGVIAHRISTHAVFVAHARPSSVQNEEVERLTFIDRSSLGAQALRRARPRARRALITARPPRVRILARNPWVRLRLISLGWKVRFINSLIDLRNVLERLGNRGYSAAELLSSNPRRWIRFRRRLRSALHPCCPRSSPGSSLWDCQDRTLCFAVLCHT